MHRKLLAILIAGGAGLITVAVVSIPLALILSPVVTAIGLPGSSMTWVALFAGGWVAAYFLPSGWHLTAPLVGFVVAAFFSALIPTAPVHLSVTNQYITLPKPGIVDWLVLILVATFGGYVCSLKYKPPQSSE